MDVWVFDTHDSDVIKERVLGNLRSMGHSVLRYSPGMYERYLLYYPGENNMTHHEHPYSSRDGEYINNIFYDCAWMEEDEVVEVVPPQFDTTTSWHGIDVSEITTEHYTVANRYTWITTT